MSKREFVLFSGAILLMLVASIAVVRMQAKIITASSDNVVVDLMAITNSYQTVVASQAQTIEIYETLVAAYEGE